jgi:poly(hydroxyalkanoate) depolymerase family esterase
LLGNKMNAPFNMDMNAVIRLTKVGRLMEATALLQRGLSGRAEQKRPSSDLDNSAGRPDGDDGALMIDMAPPSGSNRAWSVSTSASMENLPGPQARIVPATSEILRSFLDRRRGRNTWRVPADTGVHNPLPAGGQFDVHSVSNTAGTMAYKLYVPGRYAGEPLPLVVMLHGCTQTPDDFAAGTRMNEVAEELPCIVAYPEQRKAANASKCWNWFRPGDQQRDRGEPSLIADVTRQVMRDYSIDPGRVFVAGLSAGGAAAAIMGHEYPDLYKGICVHSGLACGSAKDVPSAFTAMRAGGVQTRSKQSLLEPLVPTIVFHGSSDKTVNPSNADQVVHQSRSSATTSAVRNRGRSSGGTEFTRIVETNEDGNVVLEQWILHGAGHAWSGGSKRGSYTDPRGPDASREMMRFFTEVTKP